MAFNGLGWAQSGHLSLARRPLCELCGPAPEEVASVRVGQVPRDPRHHPVAVPSDTLYAGHPLTTMSDGRDSKSL
jgi:hypothetical protein